MVGRVLLLLLLFCAGVVQAQVLGNQKVSSTLSHQSIGLDETATLSIEVKGVNNVVDVPTPSVRPDGLQIVPVGRQFSMTSVNGVSETSTTFNFLLTPLEKGRFIIDSVTVNVNGVDHATQRHRLEVTDALGYSRRPGRPSSNPWSIYPGGGTTLPSFEPDPRPRAKDLILEAELEPETVYKHQASIYTLRLLAAVRLMQDPRYSPVNPTGLIAVPLPQENSQEYRDGRGYAVTEAKTAFFPLTEGEYEFPSSHIDYTTGLFGRSGRLATEPKTLRVLPLPTKGRPDSFTGAVGEAFDLSASLDSRQVRAGQTVALRVDASGDGNLDLVPYPHLPDWNGLEKKQDEGTSQVEVIDGRVNSRRTYVFHLKVKEPGEYKLDGIALAYFRPSRERYEVVRTPSLNLTVLPAGEAGPEEGAAVERLPETDRPAEGPGSVHAAGGHITPTFFLGGSLLTLLGLVLAGGLLRRKRWSISGLKLSSNPKNLEELEAALRRLAPGNDSLSRFTELQKAGWRREEIADYEALRARVAACRYGGQPDGQPDERDLLESYRVLEKKARQRR